MTLDEIIHFSSNDLRHLENFLIKKINYMTSFKSICAVNNILNNVELAEGKYHVLVALNDPYDGVPDKIKVINYLFDNGVLCAIDLKNPLEVKYLVKCETIKKCIYENKLMYNTDVLNTNKVYEIKQIISKGTPMLKMVEYKLDYETEDLVITTPKIIDILKQRSV